MGNGYFSEHAQRPAYILPECAATRITLLVVVETDKVNIVISRVTFKIVFSVFEITHGGICEEQVMKVLLSAQVIKSESPQCNKLFGCAKILSPPEPASRMLMPGPEDHRYCNTLIIPERCQELRQVIKPGFELLMLLPSGKHRSHHPVR